MTRVLYLVSTPTERAAYEPATLTDDTATVIEAAGNVLDGTELTDYQRWDLSRIFPHRSADAITETLTEVAEDLRDWHRFDNAVEIDGWQLPEWLADLSLLAAQSTARRSIEQARGVAS